MSEQQPTAHTEDLPLDAAESESIVGGHSSPTQAELGEREIAKLEKEGFIEAACTVDGMVMFNPHTKRRVTVRL
jgi:hypothetical protein